MKYDEFGGIVVEPTDARDEFGGIITKQAPIPEEKPEWGIVKAFKQLGAIPGDIGRRAEAAGTSSVKGRNVPEKALQIAEQGGGAFGDVMGRILGFGGEIVHPVYEKLGGKKLSEKFNPKIEQGQEKLTDILTKITAGMDENTKKDILEAPNLLNFIPALMAAKPTGQAANVAAKATGRGITGAGTRAYMQEVGVLKPLARQVAPNLKEAKQKIGETIRNYKLDSPVGFNTASEKAEALFNQKWKQADDLIEQYSRENTEDITDFSTISEGLKNDIAKTIRPGERAQATATIDNITGELLDELAQQGINPSAMTPAQLVTAKRAIGAKYKNYDRTAEPVKEAVYDALESSVIGRINQFVPEAGALNIEARNIRFAQNAIDEAAGRNNKLSNWIAMAGEAAAVAPYALSHPTQAIPAVAIGILADMARRGVLSGRAASTVMNVGRGLESAATRNINPFRKEVPDVTAVPQPTLPTVPITDESRLLPPPMIPEPGQTINIKPQVPTMRNKLESIGTPGPELPIEQRVPIDINVRERISAIKPEASEQDITSILLDLAKRQQNAIRNVRLSDTEGQKIAERLGITYNGIQEGAGKLPDRYMFTSNDPKAQSSFMGANLEEATQGLQRVRNRFRGQ